MLIKTTCILDSSYYRDVNELCVYVMFPSRPGAPPCLYFLKTGKCNYFQRCKFDHPVRDKSLLTALSRRDCFDFVQSGTCPYGASCKYNHPERHVPLTAVDEEHSEPHYNYNSRTKPITATVPSVFSMKTPSHDFEPSQIRHSSPSWYEPTVRPTPSIAHSEGTDSTWSSSPDDAISAMQEGIRPFEWLVSNQQDTMNIPSQRGFDPLSYNAQLFGSPQSWTTSPAMNR